MINKTFPIIKKNFLILLHSRLSSLILVFGPILLIVLIGIGMANTGVKQINTGIYIAEKSPFTDSFINNLKYRSFIIEEFNSLDDCINSVKDSNNNICIEPKKRTLNIPPELGISEDDINNSGINYEINLHTDFSKQRVVWDIIAKVDVSVEDFSSRIRGGISEKLKDNLETYSLEIKQRRAQLNEVMTTLDSINEKIPDIKQKLEAFDSTGTSVAMVELEAAINRVYMYNSTLASSIGLREAFLKLKENYNPTLLDQNQKFIREQFDKMTSDFYEARAELRYIDNELKTLENKLNSLKQMDMNYVLNPIPLSYTSITGEQIKEISTGDKKELEFFDYLFPTLISFFILLVSVILTTNFIIRERTSNAYARNILSKAKSYNFILGNYLTILAIVVFQCFIIISIALFFLNINLIPQILNILLIILISSSIFIFLGMFIGYIFNSNETAIIASISLTLLTIIFSPLICPLETLPGILKMILSITPLVLTEDIFRRLLIFGVDITSILNSILILLLNLFMVFILVYVSYYFAKNKEIK
jgi:ABC-type multidrug transport system permease subunit